MHETSIAVTIWDQIRSVEESHPGFYAKLVEIDVGSFSGVESALLADVLTIITRDRNRSDIKFKLNPVALVAHCKECQIDFPVEKFRFECIHCGSKKLELIDGDSIRLLHVDLQAQESSKQLT